MEFIDYFLGLHLRPSSYIVLAVGVAVAYFIVVYGLLTKWWEDALGWVALLGAVAFGLLVTIAIYGLFAGEAVPEWLRTAIFSLILVSWVGQDVILHRERRAGRMEKRHHTDRFQTGPISIKKENQ